MKVLVVGGGGREHALVKKISESKRVSEVFAAPGNAGMAEDCTCVDIPAGDIEGLADFAEREEIDLTVVGPEAPLLAGIVDTFAKRKLKIFGPTRRAAEIEGSKIYAKRLMQRMGIPTARFEVFNSYQEAVKFVETADYPIVIKADGIAQGKGVVVPEDTREAVNALREMMCEGRFGEAGKRVVVEERLYGEEMSVLAFTDGETVLPLEPAQDHKKAFDGDRGPNTGGMGAYSPVPGVSSRLKEEICEKILKPVIRGLKEDGRPYQGIIYAGLMLTDAGPQVLEFNCRFGDPEAQVLLPRLENDLVETMEAAISGKLEGHKLTFRKQAAVCVVLTSAGYPGSYEKGKPIYGLAENFGDDVILYHAGTASHNGQVVTAGGRVLGVTALAEDLFAAVSRAYEVIGKVGFEGMHYRTDIGLKGLVKEN